MHKQYVVHKLDDVVDFWVKNYVVAPTHTVVRHETFVDVAKGCIVIQMDVDKKEIDDPVHHTVKLQDLLHRYDNLTARTYNVDKDKAALLLAQIRDHCNAAIRLWEEGK